MRRQNSHHPSVHQLGEYGARSTSCLAQVWPLPREPCEVIDAFFAEKAKSGMVRGFQSPHSTPTFCVRKPNGTWRSVHAYNKLNDATVPAQTPIPRKDVLLNNMSGCTLYSALDLVDGYYQILMRESDIPLTAVSTPSGMLWEWLVMPQGLSNAPATFNRLVTQLFRPLSMFAQTYFDDIFVHYRAEESQTAMEAHRKHLRLRFEVMSADSLSQRPDYELAHVSRVLTDLYDRIRLAYQEDENYTSLVQFLSDGKDAKVDKLSPRQRHSSIAMSYPGDPPQVVIPNDEDLKYDILLEAHDAPASDHLGREKTYQAVSQTFW
ncbi:Reverse transcriptase [Phytophthora palmivora]|uniref:Reverse transcriptase n=1 Tax=Phytophthora palmivora TaxID=4796 RepID=A0A2P4XYH0_9STRA|nr:Reverse transcriptase [Phytophthora palmivora]